MIELPLKEIAGLLRARVIRGDPSGEVRGVSTDSRTVQAGNLFVALLGPRFDGHEFVAAAVERGAAGAVVSREVSLPSGDSGSGVPLFLVVNTLEALQNLARIWRDRLGIPVVAVTGSNGKTTTKEMISAVLGSRFQVRKTRGNLNNLIGLPLTLLELSSEDRVAVVEMGTSGPGEIARLCEIARPDVGILTNISSAHLEFFKSLRGVQRAKAELLEHLGPEAVAILNRDDPLVMEVAGRARGRKVTFGLDSEAEVNAAQVRDLGIEGSEFILRTVQGVLPVRLPVPGLHNISNALAAVATGLVLGVPAEEAVGALELTCYPSMRMQVVRHPVGFTLINDAYNANPGSMEAALRALAASRRGGKLYFVAGDMKELGEDSEAYHRRMGRLVADLGIDVLLGVGDQMRWAVEEAENRGRGRMSVYQCDHQEAGRILLRELRPGDTVLIKGSRGMTMEKVAQSLGMSSEEH